MLTSTPKVRPFIGAMNDAESTAHIEYPNGFLATLRSRGRGPIYQKLDGIIWYRARDLDAWLANHVNESRLANIRRLTGKNVELNANRIAQLREDTQALLDPNDPNAVRDALEKLRAESAS